MLQSYSQVVFGLQSYAEQHNDAKLLEEVMKLIKTNDLPLQPGTADIVFRFVFQKILY